MTIQEFIQEKEIVEYTLSENEFVFWKDNFEDSDLNKIYTLIYNEAGELIDYFEHDLPQTFESMSNVILQKYKNLA